MEQTGFGWATPRDRAKERQIDVEIDPETRTKVIELMAHAMLAVLTAVEVTDDEW